MGRERKMNTAQLALNLFFIIVSLFYILPLVLMVSSSLDNSVQEGFSLIPREFTTSAYKEIFKNPDTIITAYGVTAFYSVVGVASSLVIMTLFAYALSRPIFKLRGVLTFLLFFTTLFNGGLVASYVIYSKYLGLNDTIWIYILPGMVNAWNIIVIRTYFKGLPQELFESAWLDGASEFRICFQIVVPLSTPVLASVGFLKFIGMWNNWSTSQVYISNPDLRSLQYLLKLILDNLAYLQQMLENGESVSTSEINSLETMRFAMAIIAVGPVLFVFPFFEKYFAKGMTLGSVKG